MLELKCPSWYDNTFNITRRPETDGSWCTGLTVRPPRLTDDAEVVGGSTMRGCLPVEFRGLAWHWSTLRQGQPFPIVRLILNGVGSDWKWRGSRRIPRQTDELRRQTTNSHVDRRRRP